MEEKTGLFFYEQTEYAMKNAINKFETLNFDALEIRRHAEKFSKKRFQKEMSNFVNTKYLEFKNKK